jgi:hypothetical protein
MVRGRSLALLFVITMSGVVGCADAGPKQQLVIGDSGACGDAFFWGVADGGTAVTISADVKDRSRTSATTVEFSVPSQKVDVQILNLDDPNFCNDLGPLPPTQAPGRDPVSGSGLITVGPSVDSAKACGRVVGEVVLTGLEAEDGTTFAPIRIESDSIGCYAG